MFQNLNIFSALTLKVSTLDICDVNTKESSMDDGIDENPGSKYTMYFPGRTQERVTRI